MMLREQMPILHRAKNLQQRNRLRFAHETPPSADSRLRGYQARPVEQPHNAPNKDRIRVDTPRDKLRSRRLITRLSQQRQRMYCDSKLTIGRNRCFSFRVYVTSIVTNAEIVKINSKFLSKRNVITR